MKINMIHAVLDFSGPGAVFSVKKDDTKLFEVYRLMQRRDAALLASFMQDTLNMHGLGFNDITHWTVGAGPGSFTGMRIASALVQGLVYSKNILSRTVPSAEAVAVSAGTDRNACVIFDGRNREIILLNLSDGQNAILNQAQAQDYFRQNKFESIAAMKYDSNAIGAIVPPEVFAEIKWAEKLDTDTFFDSEKDFDNDLTKLIYIRPSVAGASE